MSRNTAIYYEIMFKFCNRLLYIVFESLLNETIKIFVAISFKQNIILAIEICMEWDKEWTICMMN